MVRAGAAAAGGAHSPAAPERGAPGAAPGGSRRRRSTLRAGRLGTPRLRRPAPACPPLPARAAPPAPPGAPWAGAGARLGAQTAGALRPRLALRSARIALCRGERLRLPGQQRQLAPRRAVEPAPASPPRGDGDTSGPRPVRAPRAGARAWDSPLPPEEGAQGEGRLGEGGGGGTGRPGRRGAPWAELGKGRRARGRTAERGEGAAQVRGATPACLRRRFFCESGETAQVRGVLRASRGPGTPAASSRFPRARALHR